MPESNLPATLSAEDLALMEEGARTGVEHFTLRQRVVPYLRLVQAGTPYGKRSHPQYVEGCVEGDIIDTLMLKPMKQAVVIPCKYEDHWTEWEPKTEEGMGRLVKQWFTDSSKYDACPSSMGAGMPRTTAEGNVINQTPTYYCLLVDPDTGTGRPVVLALQSTQAKKSKNWNGLIDALTYNSPNGGRFIAAIYSRSYVLTTVPEKSRNRPEPYMGWVIREGELTLSMPNGRALWKHAQEVRAAVERGEMRGDQQTPREVDAEVTTRPTRSNGNTPPVSDDDIPF